MSPCPACGQPRTVTQFRLDHEPADSARDTATLRFLQSLGVELGAAVTLWYCPACDCAEAEFHYPEGAQP
jgi:hypothetical protein